MEDWHKTEEFAVKYSGWERAAKKHTAAMQA